MEWGFESLQGHQTQPEAERRSRTMHESTLADREEVARFAALSGAWWEERGPFGALHDITPARMTFIKEAVAEGLGRADLKGLSVLDIGCGGGLLSEPLARLGARVTGLDAAPEAVACARQHAEDNGLTIDYRVGGLDDLPKKQVYDLVIASEILEHVPDPVAFLTAAVAHLGPQGVLVITTLNRTIKSLLLGVVVAERILKIAPPGLHDWQHFLKPSEVSAWLRAQGLTVGGLRGLRYNPFNHTARLTSSSLDINYLLWAHR